MSETLWLALALMLVMEGLMPLLNPAAWRQVFAKLMAMTDGQLRFMGLCSVGLGLLLAVLMHH